MYYRFVYNKFYYELYGSSATLWNFWICIIACVFSFTGISTWYIWKQLPWLWAIIIGISQVINAIRGYLPFSKRIPIIKYYTYELECLINKVDTAWRKIDSNAYNFSEIEINELIEAYEKQFTEIDQRYIENSLFRNKNRYVTEATKLRDKYFEDKYHTPSYEELTRRNKKCVEKTKIPINR
jgi:hypothetical protein